MPPPSDSVSIDVEDVAEGSERFADIEVSDLLPELLRGRYISRHVGVDDIDSGVSMPDNAEASITRERVHDAELIDAGPGIFDDDVRSLSRSAVTKLAEASQECPRAPIIGSRRLEFCNQLCVANALHLVTVLLSVPVLAPGSPGQRPYGLWNYCLARTFNAWMNSQDYTHDQAFVSFYPLSGVQLVNQAGGNGLSVNNGPRMTGVRIWGYPAEPPYTGQLPYYCDGDTQLYGLVTQTQMSGCPLTGGASGGPWLSSRIDVNLGDMYAVTSRRTLSGTPWLISTPNGNHVLTMPNQMG